MVTPRLALQNRFPGLTHSEELGFGQLGGQQLYPELRVRVEGEGVHLCKQMEKILCLTKLKKFSPVFCFVFFFKLKAVVLHAPCSGERT